MESFKTSPVSGSKTLYQRPLLTAQLSADVLARLPLPQEFGAGICLQEIGRTPTQIGLIRSGIVKLTCDNLLGEERMLGLRACGWWMNASIILVGAPSFYRVWTLTQCSLSLLSTSAFRTLLEEPLVLRALLGQQSEHLVATQYTEVQKDTGGNLQVRQPRQ